MLHEWSVITFNISLSKQQTIFPIFGPQILFPYFKATLRPAGRFEFYKPVLEEPLWNFFVYWAQNGDRCGQVVIYSGFFICTKYGCKCVLYISLLLSLVICVLCQLPRPFSKCIYSLATERWQAWKLQGSKSKVSSFYVTSVKIRSEYMVEIRLG